MTDDIARFNQGLQDLLYIREKLNAELDGELERSEQLATTVSKLRLLNDEAQTTIEDTLYRIGVWKDETPLPDNSTAEMANRFASKPQESVRQVVNDSYRVN